MSSDQIQLEVYLRAFRTRKLRSEEWLLGHPCGISVDGRSQRDFGENGDGLFRIVEMFWRRLTVGGRWGARSHWSLVYDMSRKNEDRSLSEGLCMKITSDASFRSTILTKTKGLSGLVWDVFILGIHPVRLGLSVRQDILNLSLKLNFNLTPTISPS